MADVPLGTVQEQLAMLGWFVRVFRVLMRMIVYLHDCAHSLQTIFGMHKGITGGRRPGGYAVMWTESETDDVEVWHRGSVVVHMLLFGEMEV